MPTMKGHRKWGICTQRKFSAVCPQTSPIFWVLAESWKTSPSQAAKGSPSGSLEGEGYGQGRRQGQWSPQKFSVREPIAWTLWQPVSRTATVLCLSQVSTSSSKWSFNTARVPTRSAFSFSSTGLWAPRQYSSALQD